MTGGWQTSKESAYVQASRARHATEWFVAREELEIEGQDERRLDQLAAKMRGSRAQTPSLAYREQRERAWDLGYEDTVHRERGIAAGLARPLQRTPEQEQSPGLSR